MVGDHTGILGAVVFFTLLCWVASGQVLFQLVIFWFSVIYLVFSQFLALFWYLFEFLSLSQDFYEFSEFPSPSLDLFDFLACPCIYWIFLTYPCIYLILLDLIAFWSIFSGQHYKKCCEAESIHHSLCKWGSCQKQKTVETNLHFLSRNQHGDTNQTSFPSVRNESTSHLGGLPVWLVVADLNVGSALEGNPHSCSHLECPFYSQWPLGIV